METFIWNTEHAHYDEPENCPKEYNDCVCDDCGFREYEMVSHPGGCSYTSVEKAKCGWGHWEDAF